jgi:hypothetical protein
LTIDPDLVRLPSGAARAPIDIRPAAEGTVPTFNPTAPPPALPSNLIHHPLGLPLVIVKCAVKGAEQDDLLHDCTSTPGSSGSLLLDEKMRWFGLHYMGPYPNEWTLQQVYNDVVINGPRYNRAKPSERVWQFFQQP